MLNVKASEETLAVFNDQKLKKKIAYLIYHITVKQDNAKEEEITIKKQVDKADVDAKYIPNFIADLKAGGGCAFATLDWNNKLLFVAWSPDTAKGKDKMVYATVKEQFVQELVGIQLKVQATDDSELSEEIINEKTMSKV